MTRDLPRPCECQALDRVALRIEARAVRIAEIGAGAISRRQPVGLVHSVTTPCADLGEIRQAGDLQPPSLVVGEVKVQRVQLKPRHRLQNAEHLRLAAKVAGDVDEQAPIGEARRVGDGLRRRVRPQLSQGLQAVKHSCVAGADQSRALSRVQSEAISFVRGEARDASNGKLKRGAGAPGVCGRETRQDLPREPRLASKLARRDHRRGPVQPHKAASGAVHDRRRQYPAVEVKFICLDQLIANEQIFGRLQTADVVREAVQTGASRCGERRVLRKAAADAWRRIENDVGPDRALVGSHRRVGMLDHEFQKTPRRDRARVWVRRTQAEERSGDGLHDNLHVSGNGTGAGQAVEVDPPALAGNSGLTDIAQAERRPCHEAARGLAGRIGQDPPVESEVRRDFRTFGAAVPGGRDARQRLAQTRYDHCDHGERSAIPAPSLGLLDFVAVLAIRAKSEIKRYSQELNLNRRLRGFEQVRVGRDAEVQIRPPCVSGLFQSLRIPI